MSSRGLVVPAVLLSVIAGVLTALPASADDQPAVDPPVVQPDDPTPSPEPSPEPSSAPDPSVPTPDPSTPTPDPTIPTPTTPTPTTPTAPRPTTPPSSPPVVVVGDSISSVDAHDRYRRGVAGEDTRRPLVWWARLVRDAGLRPTDVLPLTEGGSGYLRPGSRTASGSKRYCSGTTFGQRLRAVRAARPKVLIVAGGRNDTTWCVGRKSGEASAAQQRSAVRSFYAQLGATADAIGLPRSRVYVFVPWGTSEIVGRSGLVQEIEQAARGARLSFVPVPHLRRSELMDSAHPNGTGAIRIAQALAEGSTVTSALAALRPVAVTPTRPVAVRAVSPCAASERSQARSSTWGRRGAAGLVDARLAAAGRVPVRPGPRSWLDRARAAGGVVVAQPAAGDVAWWPSAPHGGLGRGEHVATVRGVYRGGLDVRVVESSSSRTCRRTSYGAAALPRVYVRLPRSSGSPMGRLESVRAGRRTVSVGGWALDPDSTSGSTAVRVTVRAGSDVLARREVPRRFDRFTAAVSLPAKQARPGRRVQVVVEALNAPRTNGRSAVRLGSRTLRLAR